MVMFDFAGGAYDTKPPKNNWGCAVIIGIVGALIVLYLIFKL
jgi:hypothetical protein